MSVTFTRSYNLSYLRFSTEQNYLQFRYIRSGYGITVATDGYTGITNKEIKSLLTVALQNRTMHMLNGVGLTMNKDEQGLGELL